MMHMRGGGGGHGIEGMTPPIGPIASASSIGAFLAFVALVVKHPRVAFNCALTGLGVAWLFALFGAGTGGTGVSNSVFTFVLVIVLGCLLGDGKSYWRRPDKPARVQPPVIDPVTRPDRITTNHMLAYATAMTSQSKGNDR